MADSVHLARWLSQFADEAIDFTIFPSSPHRHIHPMIASHIRAQSSQLSVTIEPPYMKLLALPFSALDIVLGNRLRSRVLRRLMSNQAFDVVHAVELQHAGYLVLGAGLQQNELPLYVTNWGSDIYWFRQFPRHREKIVALLKLADVYSAECSRDINLAREMGFTGVVRPIIPNSGGIDVNRLPVASEPPSHRRTIIIKGYTQFVGRALVALRACELIAEQLTGYEVLIYSASPAARFRALKLRFAHRVKVRIIKKRTSHDDMLRHFSRSRVYMGISLSDGISTSLLEAMATGCYPIQTGTGCADEWLSAGSGSIVSPDSPEEVAQHLREALTNDELVDEAAIINRARIEEKANSTSVSSIARMFYSRKPDH
jgi:glycosyltransferase involved in cell wall biosynthesis